MLLCFSTFLIGCSPPAEETVAEIEENLDTKTSECALGGKAVKGVINAATVTVYSIDADGKNSTEVGQGLTAPDGSWSAAPSPCTEDNYYRVEVSGGNYTSESTMESVTNTVTYSAIVDLNSIDISSSAESLAITPISTFVFSVKNRQRVT